ncbi:uncharacterized protein ACO6RY_03416 [Pungitius sinensis]
MAPPGLWERSKRCVRSLVRGSEGGGWSGYFYLKPRSKLNTEGWENTLMKKDEATAARSFFVAAPVTHLHHYNFNSSAF